MRHAVQDARSAYRVLLRVFGIVRHWYARRKTERLKDGRLLRGVRFAHFICAFGAHYLPALRAFFMPRAARASLRAIIKWAGHESGGLPVLLCTKERPRRRDGGHMSQNLQRPRSKLSIVRLPDRYKFADAACIARQAQGRSDASRDFKWHARIYVSKGNHHGRR